MNCGQITYQNNRILFSTKRKCAMKPQKDIEETELHILSQSSQSEKSTYYMISIIRLSGKAKLWRQ